MPEPREGSRGVWTLDRGSFVQSLSCRRVLPRLGMARSGRVVPAGSAARPQDGDQSGPDFER